jgi:SAM-dependent methyltransferase
MANTHKPFHLSSRRAGSPALRYIGLDRESGSIYAQQQPIMTIRNYNGVELAGLGASPEVQDFYDRYPYPRPVADLQNYGRLWQDHARRVADFHLFWPAATYREDYSILVAGCGTSQAAKYAIRWPHARVTGIDFSATSLAKTEELKQKHNLTNLNLQQLPIERAEELGANFDQIVCTGVLHHLVDPDAGLRALHNVLKPNGAMHLMVYAPYGRAGIYMLQDFCRRLGISASDDAIRDLILALKALPPGHPMEAILRTAPDFGDAAELADALLHPQDRAYSVPEFLDFLERAGLAFGRWTRQAPYSPRCGLVASLPQAARINELPLEQQFAAVELFRGTMLRHSAVVYHNALAAERQRIDFSGDAWLGYVPIQLADTVCVMERVPPGAAAVLINRGHTFRDIFLPITAIEKRLFDAMDGERTIGQIIRAAVPLSSEPGTCDFARHFFEQIWWHDHVVFHKSGGSQAA